MKKNIITSRRRRRRRRKRRSRRYIGYNGPYSILVGHVDALIISITIT